MIHYRHLDTPIGQLLIAGHAEGLVRVAFEASSQAVPDADWQASPCALLDQAAQELQEYFAGERQQFTVPLAPQGTPFQLAVWQALSDIPYGATCSYRAIATQLDNPKAVRAVGTANGKNPLPIIVPCHRVIGSNGTLTGFTGGLSVKQQLLTLEGGM